MTSAPSDLSSWLSGADKIIIFDLEWTSWTGFMESGWSMPGKHREIIQIGAVKVDCQNDFKEISSFDLLVKPSITPDLSEYITALTGVTQEQVDAEGVAFSQALQEFLKFCGGVNFACSYGDDNVVIAENCALHNIDCPDFFAGGFNLCPLFSEALGVTGQGINSGNLTAHLGLPTVGNPHNALADARGIAAALHHLMTSQHLRHPTQEIDKCPAHADQ